MIDGFEDNGMGLLLPKPQILVKGFYEAEIIRGGETIDKFSFENTVVNEGLNSLLNVYLNGSTPNASWYLGLFTGNYTPVATDTGATIAGNATESNAYTASTRPQWTPSAASGQSITNSGSRAAFTFNASATIYGAFLIANATIGGTTGPLFSAARFGTSKAVVAADELLLTYTFTAASS